ncbi:MAG: anthranilate phosphoribosyltransferase [Acidimicrobiia bacterium]
MTTLADFGGWPTLLGRLVAGEDLSAAEAEAGLAEILAGDATAAQIAAFVVALRAKGETADELAGLLSAVLAARIPVRLQPDVQARAIDIVGTGGDRSHSVNVSTMSAFVVAGAGVPVCKHGNRAASSSCGAADLLEELGVAIELPAEGVQRCVEEAGIGFCFAPRFHPAFRHAGPIRREIGVPTAFNLLGPMANPARVPFMLVGVAADNVARRMIDTLAAHDVTRAWVVHGDDGLDELSTTTISHVLALEHGEVRSFDLDPLDHGLERATMEQLRGGPPAENAAIARALLDGKPGPVRSIVTLNAGAALVVAGRVATLDEGIAVAAATIDAGHAAAVLERFVVVSQDAAAHAPQ